jgi:hypothetical protein
MEKNMKKKAWDNEAVTTLGMTAALKLNWGVDTVPR